jgi:alkylation response protein AidB-like acyl-CoA dehydrogenase
MAIDFTMPPHVLEIRDKVRAFIKEEIEPAETEMRKNGNWRDGIIELGRKARQRGLWLPHMPKEFGGLGLDAMAIAVISAECGRTRAIGAAGRWRRRSAHDADRAPRDRGIQTRRLNPRSDRRGPVVSNPRERP